MLGNKNCHNVVVIDGLIIPLFYVSQRDVLLKYGTEFVALQN
jgi:hypothetical protein